MRRREKKKPKKQIKPKNSTTYSKLIRLFFFSSLPSAGSSIVKTAKTSFHATPAATTIEPPNGFLPLITARVGEMNLTATPDPQCVDYGALWNLFAVLYSIIFLLGLAGNVVALWVFFCVHAKKNSVRVFLINVAFADLLLVACLPFRILYHSQGNVWKLHPTLCKAVGNLFYMNMYISVTLLGLISIDRYLKIHRRVGMQHRLQSTKWSRGLCAVVWIVAFALTFVLLMSNSHSQVNR